VRTLTIGAHVHVHRHLARLALTDTAA